MCFKVPNNQGGAEENSGSMENKTNTSFILTTYAQSQTILLFN